MYTADLHDITQNCQLHQYADDTQLYYSFLPSDIQAAYRYINSNLASLSNFSSRHELVLNVSHMGYSSHEVLSERMLDSSLYTRLKMTCNCYM